MTLTRRAFLAYAAAAMVARPAFATTTLSVGGPAFGSYWRLTVPDTTDSGSAVVRINEVVARIDALMSPYRADSDLSRFNRCRVTFIAVAPETLSVARTALEVARETDGAFDPAVGPIVARHGFGPIRDAEPGRFTQLDVTEHGLCKDEPGLSMDLCGIAKGYALDLMCAEVEACGIANFLLELGGEVAARGRHPTGRAWRVGLDGAPLALTLADETVATSGILAQSYRIGSRRYGHIVNPATGAPAAGALVSVSVLAPTGTRADALATALFAMGTERGVDHARATGLSAVFLARDGKGFRTVATGHAAQQLKG